MARSAFIVLVVVLACGCGGSRRDDQTSRAAANARAAEPASQPNSSPDTTAADSAQAAVTLVGCLRGGESAPAEAGGTVGTRTAASASGAPVGSNNAPAASRFRLVDARPETAASGPAGAGQSPGSAGVGANGAGGSGGPLVSGVSTYELEGPLAELGAQVNHQVRITGRIDPRETLAEARGGSSAVGSGAAGSSSSATGTTGAAGANGAADARTSTGSGRHVTVDSVQMIAASCGAAR